MKFMSTWTVAPGTLRETVNRFLAGQGEPLEGVTLLGRWHKADLSGGYALYETSNLGALYESAAAWTDLLGIHTVPVIEDAEAGPILAKVFKQ